jgi:hypothetical protein
MKEVAPPTVTLSYRIARCTAKATGGTGRSTVFVGWVRARTMEEARLAVGRVLRERAVAPW